MEDMQWQMPDYQNRIDKPRKKKKGPWLLYVLIAILILGLVYLIECKEMLDEEREHPPEEIALYLEQCFGLQFSVTYNTVSAFSDSRYAGQIPYTAVTVLEDGSSLTFSVGLDRSYPYMEGGLYTDFEEEMLSHYASSYGIVCDTDTYYTSLYPTREQIEGEEPVLKQFLDALMAGSYIQSGQEIELYIYPTESWNENVKLNRDEPINYTELSNKLITLLERFG